MEALLAPAALAVLGSGVGTAPEYGRRGGGDRDAALALLGHPVHHGVTVVDLAQLVGEAGVEQDALRRRRLAGIDMSHDANVSDPP